MKDYKTWQRWDTTLDGEPVTMELKTLKRSSMLKLIPLMDRVQTIKENDAEGIQNMLKLVDEGIEAITDHVRDIQGFTVNGEQPTLESIAEETAFTNLILEIMTRLVSISVISKEDEKN